MEDDALHGGGQGDERDDPHLSTACGAQKREHLGDAGQELGPEDTTGSRWGRICPGSASPRPLRMAWNRVLEEIRERKGDAVAKDRERPHGLGFHGFCRTTITDQMGSDAAAEYSGRSRSTVYKYKRTRDSETLRAAETMADRLAEKRGPGSGEGGESSLAARHKKKTKHDN